MIVIEFLTFFNIRQNRRELVIFLLQIGKLGGGPLAGLAALGLGGLGAPTNATGINPAGNSFNLKVKKHSDSSKAYFTLYKCVCRPARIQII